MTVNRSAEQYELMGIYWACEFHPFSTHPLFSMNFELRK